ncbi:MAG: tRNA pseudouridine(38-40) synthase TruA [Flavisolibacter sp.]
MSRYFLELAYRGTRYKGFQIQENSNTIQSEVETALATIQRSHISLTGSSRTDTGVHALQNYFHFDFEGEINPHLVYKMNALLPNDIAIKNCILMKPESHSRFDALSRRYHYRIHRKKDPFFEGLSFFYPYKLDMLLIEEATMYLRGQTNFFAFAKTNSQVKNFNCSIIEGKWTKEGEQLVFTIEANRFLRGMVRQVTASLLKVGRHQLSMEQFRQLFTEDEKCGYSVPPQGLFLQSVKFPLEYFPAPLL